MKILYITTISPTINAFLVPHIKYLINQGHIVDVATNITDCLNEELIDIGVRVFNVDFQRIPISFKNIKAYNQIKEIQNKEKYDVVHVHTPVASFIARYALRNENSIKIVYTCHGFHFYKGGSWINWAIFYPLEKIAAKWTDALITINSEDYEVASKFKLRNNGKISKIYGVGIEKEKYIIDCFDRSKYRNKLGIGVDDFVILVLAELNKNKNHRQLIEAMKLLKQEYTNIKVIFAGTGPLEENIKKEIKKNGLEDNISLLGWRNDVNALINSSDLVGLFSKREGLGKCLLEAMVCKKCVIATKTRGAREFVKSNINGFMVEIDDIETTVNSIKKIYIDKNLKSEFEEMAIETADKYLIDNVLRQLTCVYKNLYK